MDDLGNLSKEDLINLAKRLQEENESLLKENTEMAWNDEYGCYTRPGFQKKIWPYIAPKAQWLVYFDIDGMGELNARYTHAGVNARIKKSLEIRMSDFLLTGQRYSGDEFFICITDDSERGETNPVELAVRLKAALHENGLSATFAVAPVISDDLMETLEPAVQLVEQAKERNERGTITLAPGEPR